MQTDRQTDRQRDGETERQTRTQRKGADRATNGRLEVRGLRSEQPRDFGGQEKGGRLAVGPYPASDTRRRYVRYALAVHQIRVFPTSATRI
eukprot:3698182-Rhodomonas_salina.1